MTDTLLKPALSIEPAGGAPSADPQPVRIWDMDIDPDHQNAIDAVIDHLIITGARPSVQMTGGLVDIVAAIMRALSGTVPAHLSDSLKTMVDYIALMLCDYVEETGTVTMRVAFGFNPALNDEGAAA